ncbi:MAG: hypothetical protein LBQ08_05125 [Holosporaceae bacterium]|jgi:hypothetical protein|nr:hypothetical protein [Holosporaceae bacterium]
MKKMLMTIGVLVSLFQMSETCSAVSNEDEDTGSYKSGKETYEGFYIGAGVIQSNVDSKAEATSHSYEAHGLNPQDFQHSVSQIMGDTAVLACFVGSYINEVTVNLDGNQHVVGVKAEGLLRKEIVKGKANKLGGSVSIGYGRFVYHDIYLGADLGFDIADNKEKRVLSDLATNGFDVNLKQNGFIPTLSARLGMYCNTLEALLYCKIGLSNPSIELASNFGNIKLSKIAGVVGLGMEKKIGPVLLRCEFDHRLHSKKTVGIRLSDETVPFDAGVGPHMEDFSHRINVETKIKSNAIRLMAIMPI